MPATFFVNSFARCRPSGSRYRACHATVPSWQSFLRGFLVAMIFSLSLRRSPGDDNERVCQFSSTESNRRTVVFAGPLRRAPRCATWPPIRSLPPMRLRAHPPDSGTDWPCPLFSRTRRAWGEQGRALPTFSTAGQEPLPAVPFQATNACPRAAGAWSSSAFRAVRAPRQRDEHGSLWRARQLPVHVRSTRGRKRVETYESRRAITGTLSAQVSEHFQGHRQKRPLVRTLASAAVAELVLLA
jgi:hypothetical protein